MYTDQNGNTVTGATPEALVAYETAVRAFNIYRGAPIALIEEAIDAAPEFTMAHLLKAYLYRLATELGANAEALDILAHLSTLAVNDREQAHREALTSLLTGNWT